jgi:SAM-dependent methyltransferase
MNERIKFYQESVSSLITYKEASILICGGGDLDKTIFEKLGFIDVTICNLDSRLDESRFNPYKWKFENAETLSFDNSSFDYVVIHAAIHHASLPHKVITEMYRVAKIGILAIEARDSLLMQMIEKIGLTTNYEHAAVYYNDCIYGGVNNSDIPNFVYRWTEREIEKCIKSFAPHFIHKFKYRYGTAFPALPSSEKKGSLKLYFLKVVQPFYYIFVKIFPKQKNLFAFYIKKPNIPDDLFPWIVFDEKKQLFRFNKEWGDQKFKKK